ncbi:hypothetical protein ACFYT3_26000 [Nocardia amikacinitolerans]|uniref:hypothetical protein n=1 Tax=Nocardia amikacinitolerans TaxID=756689 RepID=UPI0036C234BA
MSGGQVIPSGQVRPVIGNVSATSPLAEFAAMVEQCPQFRSAGNTVKTFTRQVWDPQNLEWTDVRLELPAAKADGIVKRERRCRSAIPRC